MNQDMHEMNQGLVCSDQLTKLVGGNGSGWIVQRGGVPECCGQCHGYPSIATATATIKFPFIRNGKLPEE